MAELLDLTLPRFWDIYLSISAPSDLQFAFEHLSNYSMQLKVYNLYVMIVMLINTILSSWSVLFYFCHHGFFFHFKMKSCLKFIWIKLPEKDEQRWTQIKINTLKDKTLFIFMNFLYSKKKKNEIKRHLGH